MLHPASLEWRRHQIATLSAVDVQFLVLWSEFGSLSSRVVQYLNLTSDCLEMTNRWQAVAEFACQIQHFLFKQL